MRSLSLSRRNLLAGVAVTGALPGLARASDVPSSAEAAWFDFRLSNKKIFVPVRINGVEAMAFLDTGVSSTVIDAEFAERVGLKAVRQNILSGWGREEGVDETEGVTLELPGVGIDGLSAVLRPLADLRRAIGEPFDVIVGRGLFDNFVVELDFDQSRARISARKGFKPPTPTLALKLKPSGGQLAAPVRLEGHTVMAAIDLGASMPVSVSIAMADKLGLFQGRRVSSVLTNGLGGPQVCSVVSTQHLDLGPYALPPAPAVIFEDLTHEAVLGLPVFSRFRLWLDYGGRRMWLAPAGGYWTPFDKNRVGLYTQTQDDGASRVTHVSRGSPAELAGFMIGDQLRAPGTGAPLLRDGQITPGAALRYEMADGTVRTLLAADYY